MELFYLIIIVALIGFIISNRKKQGSAAEPDTSKELKIYPYAKKMLLTKTEYTFYKMLRSETDANHFIVCPKVRLEDFMQVTDKDNRTKYRGYIKSRHIDFLICDNSLNILCGIELDDKTHNTQKAQTTDNFKDNAFKAIGIPLHRVKTSSNYADEITKIINSFSKTEA